MNLAPYAAVLAIAFSIEGETLRHVLITNAKEVLVGTQKHLAMADRGRGKCSLPEFVLRDRREFASDA